MLPFQRFRWVVGVTGAFGLLCWTSCSRSGEVASPATQATAAQPTVKPSAQRSSVDAAGSPAEAADAASPMAPPPDAPHAEIGSEVTLSRIELGWHEWVRDEWDSSVQLADLGDGEMFVFDEAVVARSTEEGFTDAGFRTGLPNCIVGFWASALGGRWPADVYLGLSHTVDSETEYEGAQLYRWEPKNARWKLVHGNTEGLLHYVGLSHWETAPHRMVGVLGGGAVPSQTIVTIPSRVSSPFETPGPDPGATDSLMRPSAFSVGGDRLFVVGWSDVFASGFVETFAWGKPRPVLHFMNGEGESLHLDAVDAVDQNDAWVGGWSKDCSNKERARLFHYSGSRWWTEVRVPIAGRITSLDALDDGTLWVVVQERLLRRDTNDMWTELAIPPQFGARQVVVWSDSDLWLAGRRGVLRTRPAKRVFDSVGTCLQTAPDDDASQEE